MKITRLKLENFRKFDDFDLEFSPGLNLIRGPNESGKSTIVRSIVAALFEKPSGGTARGKLNARWGSATAPAVLMEFDDEDGHYVLVKDFAEGKALLQQPEGKPLSSVRAVDSKVYELLGFRDPSQYLRTACVTHDQMVSLGDDTAGSRKIAGMLREIVIGSDESAAIDKALRTIDAEVEGLKRGMERPTNNPGTIRRLQEEREMYMVRQKDLSLGVNDLEDQRRRLADVEAQLVELHDRLADLDRLLETNSRLMEAERQGDEAQSRFETAERAGGAIAAVEAKDLQIEEWFEGFDDIDPGAQEKLKKSKSVRESYEALKSPLNLEGQWEEEREETPEAEQVQAERPGQPSKAFGFAFMGAGFIVLVLSGVLGATVHPAFYSLLALAIFLLAFGAYATAWFSRPSDLDAAPQAGPAPDTSRLDVLAKAGSEAARLAEGEREFLRSVGCADCEEFFERYDAYRSLLAERNEMAAGARALLAGQPVENIASARRKAALDMAAAEEVASSLEPFRLSPDDLIKRERERESVSTEADRLSTERDGLSFHLVKTASDPEEAVKIEEVVTWLWEAEQSARRRLRVYTLAKDAMRQASDEMLSSAVPVLAQSVGDTFSLLTGGRYDEVEVRESDLSISVYSPEKGEMVSGDELLNILSKGTASQLYLSARLQLVDLLSAGRRPPLIFDDSFSYFDSSRLKMLWDVLADISSEQQVLLFTCTDRYDGLADGVKVIDLP